MMGLPMEAYEVKKELLLEGFPTEEVLRKWDKGEEADWVSICNLQSFLAPRYEISVENNNHTNNRETNESYNSFFFFFFICWCMFPDWMNLNVTDKSLHLTSTVQIMKRTLRSCALKLDKRLNVELDQILRRVGRKEKSVNCGTGKHHGPLMLGRHIRFN